MKAAVAGVLAAHGRIDGLVNNAGGQFPPPLAAIIGQGLAGRDRATTSPAAS